MFRSRQSVLEPYLAKLRAEWDAGCRNGAELWRRMGAADFKGGLRVVTAALTEPWSNGQTGGQITKLKLVKRQMYGRARLDLLRARLVASA